MSRLLLGAFAVLAIAYGVYAFEEQLRYEMHEDSDEHGVERRYDSSSEEEEDKNIKLVEEDDEEVYDVESILDDIKLRADDLMDTIEGSYKHRSSMRRSSLTRRSNRRSNRRSPTRRSSVRASSTRRHY